MAIDIKEFGKLKPVTAEDDERLIKEKKKKYNKKYNKEHKKERVDYNHKNREKENERSNKWRRDNPEKRRGISRKHYRTHKGQYTEEHRIYCKEHPEFCREIDAKSHAKRKRGLGFEPLNEPFEGAEGHHINLKEVIYIPKELHKSVKHNVFTGEGMEEINALAFEFLKREAFEDQLINVPIGKKKEETIQEQITE